MPTLDHIALACRDPLRSLRFYRDVMGLDGRVRSEEFGFVISTGSGVEVTLLRGEPPASMGDFHFGVSLFDASAVRHARERFASLSIVEKEWWDEPGYVAVKVVDPDGYIVEVFWEDHRPA